MKRWKQNHNWNPGAVWLKKKTLKLPTRCTSCRLNLHDPLGRLCIYGIYERSLRIPTKENALVLITVRLEARTYRSRTSLESELPPQQLQRSAQRWRASEGGEMDWDSRRGKGLGQQWLKRTFIVLMFWLVLSILLDFFPLFSLLTLLIKPACPFS